MDMRTTVDDAQAEGIAKIVIDLTGLLGALRTATVPSKPWQRQLLRDLDEADTYMQVLRMTIALNRHDGEIRAAAQSLVTTLGRSAAVVGRGRADEGTRDAMRLIAALARELNSRMATYGD